MHGNVNIPPATGTCDAVTQVYKALHKLATYEDHCNPGLIPALEADIKHLLNDC